MINKKLHELAINSAFKSNYVSKTESTNLIAKKELNKSLSKQVFLTDVQTSGKGRFDRSWSGSSNDGQIYSTWVYSTESPLFYAPLLVGAHLHKFFCNYFNMSFDLKVPNDLYLNSKKVTGILCESLQSGNQLHLIIGIGINLFSNPDLEVAGSICNESDLNKSEFLNELLNSMTKLELELKKNSQDLREYLIDNAYCEDKKKIVNIDKDFNIQLEDKLIKWSDL